MGYQSASDPDAEFNAENMIRSVYQMVCTWPTPPEYDTANPTLYADTYQTYGP
jgi:hypothetical protein